MNKQMNKYMNEWMGTSSYLDWEGMPRDWGVEEPWVEGAVVSPTGTPSPGRHRVAAWPLLDSFQS